MDESYIAGFFDGEGSAYIKKYKSKGHLYDRLVAKLTQVDRVVLDEIVDYVGCGGVYEKYDKRAKENGWQVAHEAVWQDRSARQFLVTVEPLLIVKKEKVSGLLDVTGRDITSRRKRSVVV
jgi:hypothetical protein